MSRIAFVQRLRVALTALVVAHHAAQAYGPTGGSWPVRETSTFWLGPFMALNASFFMGCFFLLAGLFTPLALERKGPAAYVRGRLRQLGLPLLLFTLVVMPLALFAFGVAPLPYSLAWFASLVERGLPFAHLWFVAWLLVFSLAYALLRRLRPEPAATLPLPGDRLILVFVLGLGMVSALVRLAFPQDVWIRLLGLPIEPAHLPQYLALFAVGLVAGPGRWLETISTRRCLACFGLGGLAFILALVTYASAESLPDPRLVQPIWGFLEAPVCVGMVLGLVALFRAFGLVAGRIISTLDRLSFVTYLVHWPIVVALHMALLPLALPPTAKFFIVTATAWALSTAMAVAWDGWSVGTLKASPPADRRSRPHAAD